MISINDLSVFVVEPSASQAEHIKSRLQKIGVPFVSIFNSGAQALEAMRERHPDVVFSSMHLPDMTGGELVGHIRSEDWGQDSAFILISSETNPRYLEPVRQGGSCAILGKPFTIDQLKRALNTCLYYLGSHTDDKSEGADEGSLEAVKVLLVDDSRSARLYIRRVLEHLGIHDFTEAADGREAAGIVDKEFFDLVVTDYNMPEMDGRELTEYIRTKSWQSTVPILMVSSESNESRLAAVTQAGVSGVCDKPFEPTVIKALLHRMLKGE